MHCIADCLGFIFYRISAEVTLPNWVGRLKYLGRTAGKFAFNKTMGGRTFCIKRTTLGTALVSGFHGLKEILVRLGNVLVNYILAKI